MSSAWVHRYTTHHSSKTTHLPSISHPTFTQHSFYIHTTFILHHQPTNTHHPSFIHYHTIHNSSTIHLPFIHHSSTIHPPFIHLSDRLPLRHQGDRYFIFRIISPISFQPPIEIATTSEEDMQEWLSKIRQSSCNAERQVSCPECLRVVVSGCEWL